MHQSMGVFLFSLDLLNSSMRILQAKLQIVGKTTIEDKISGMK